MTSTAVLARDIVSEGKYYTIMNPSSVGIEIPDYVSGQSKGAMLETISNRYHKSRYHHSMAVGFPNYMLMFCQKQTPTNYRTIKLPSFLYFDNGNATTMKCVEGGGHKA